MNWITRERPKIDRIACPWLIKRFIDRQAVFHFVPLDEVKEKAEALDGIPFDIPGVEYTHYNDKCTFDYFIKKQGLKDKAILEIAKIVRGADMDKHYLSRQSAGLWAIFSGLSFNIEDDHELLKIGLTIYDALYSWAKHLRDVKHIQNENESLFYDLFEKFLRDKPNSEKTPYWAKELDRLIHEQIESDLKLSLKEVAAQLQVHPAYLSRVFSKYFNNLSFTEYIRKVKIEKAITLLETTDYPLSQIAYAVGFSDQSHFTKNFKKEVGVQPSIYRKNLSR